MDYFLTVHKENMVKEGHELVKKLLNIMQVYKSSGAVDRARKLYSDYSSVDDKYLELIKFFKSKKKPGGLRTYPNIV